MSLKVPVWMLTVTVASLAPATGKLRSGDWFADATLVAAKALAKAAHTVSAMNVFRVSFHLLSPRVSTVLKVCLFDVKLYASLPL